jgi:hypothetical protein
MRALFIKNCEPHRIHSRCALGITDPDLCKLGPDAPYVDIYDEGHVTAPKKAA